MKMFIKLIVNELYKSFLQKKTIALFIVIILATCGLAWLANKDNVKDWKKDYESQIVENKNRIEMEKKAEHPNQELIESLNNFTKLREYQIKHNIPENNTNLYKFIDLASMNITIIIMLFMAAFSADVIASEYAGGTIRQILVKPVHRWKIFLAKFFSTVIVSTTLFVFNLVVAALIGLIVFGNNSTTIHDARLSEGKIIIINMLSNIGWTTVAQIFSLVVVSTITFFVATVTRKSALAIIITFILLFGGAAISEFFMKYDFYKYILMPNLMLNAYLPAGWTPFEGATFQFSLGVCLSYAILFFAAGMFVFNKRDIY